TESRLRQILGIGTSLGNPLDSGFTGLSDRELYIQCVEALADDPNIHVVVAQEELLREPGNQKKEGNLARLEELVSNPSHKPIAMLSMLSHAVTDYGRELRQRFPHLPFLQDVEKGLRAVQRVAEYAMRCRRPVTVPTAVDPPPAVLDWLQQARAHAASGGVVGERESDALLRLYQIPVVTKALAHTQEEAVSLARDLGFPVVLKVASVDLPHKTEVGGVMVNLWDEEAVRRAWQVISERVLRHAPQARVEGMLVAPHLAAEIEVVLGVHRDPEMGPVVMVGAGGTAVELDPDVAFAPPGLSALQARECLERTRLAKRLGGFRGTAPLDREGLVQAMVKLGRLALEVGERLEALDINPVFLRRDAPTVVAVDSLAVLAASGGEAR
ncbi:MAG: acetate--CoA ligase family protein, partial [Firmicutes bacterium]|nr:acetate--CoA ligase family protein [Bacillota bacterium]